MIAWPLLAKGPKQKDGACQTTRASHNLDLLKLNDLGTKTQ